MRHYKNQNYRNLCALRAKWPWLLFVAALFQACMPPAHAQIDQSAIQSALDNQHHGFFARGFGVSSQTSTRGGTSMINATQSFSSNFTPVDSELTTFLSFQDVTVTWDYNILDGSDIEKFSIKGFDSFGELIVHELSTQPTKGWRQGKIYFPSEIGFFKWAVFHGDSRGVVLIDNVRIVRGNQLSNDIEERRECLKNNPAFSNPISEAVDNTLFDFFTNEGGFFAQDGVTRFGGDALQSKSLQPGEEVFVGVGIQSVSSFVLEWHWKVSAGRNGSGLEFILFDQDFNPTTTRLSFTGEKDWQQASVEVPSGTHFPIWFYVQRDEGFQSQFVGRKRGWIDKVRIGGLLDEECETSMVPISPIFQLLLNE